LAVHIRLRRMGAKKRAFYRIVAADSRRARDGRFLETLGTYDPITKPAMIKLHEDKLSKWLNEGAIASDTVRTLLTQVGFNEKYYRAQKGEDVSGVEVKTTITERKKKTRQMKNAAIAAAEAAKAEAEAKVKAAEEKAAADAKAAEEKAAAAQAPAEEPTAEEAPADEEKSE
jgi:small subunit ribosomal protein S16